MGQPVWLDKDLQRCWKITLGFTVTALAASARSAGKTYEEAVDDHWLMTTPMPQGMAKMIVYNAEEDVRKIASLVDFVFCAVNMKKRK